MEENYKIYALFDKNYPKDIRYIGLTKETIQQRRNRHKREKCNTYKYNWIKKIGSENLEVVLLMDNLSQKEACDNEIRLIKEYRELGYRLTNITNGGEGWNNTEFTEEHKKNISKNHANVRGENNPMYGKNHTKETLLKISKSKKEKFKGYSEDYISNKKLQSQGEGNNRAILTEDKILEIRKLSNEGIQNYVLAKMFNVKVPAIWKIVNRYTWKHI